MGRQPEMASAGAHQTLILAGVQIALAVGRPDRTRVSVGKPTLGVAT